MKRRLIALCLFAAPITTFAADEGFLGTYVGVGGGLADIRTNSRGSTTGNFSKNDLGLKAFLGVRPISWLGLELSYIDYGNPSGTYAGQDAEANLDSTTVSALVFLPLGIPSIDLYGKYGYTHVSGYLDASNVSYKLSGSGQTVGLGGQWTIRHWALRAEYEYANTTYGDGTLFSLSVVRSLF